MTGWCRLCPRKANTFREVDWTQIKEPSSGSSGKPHRVGVLLESGSLEGQANKLGVIKLQLSPQLFLSSDVTYVKLVFHLLS